MGAQRLIDMGFEGYRGWGDVEAEADFRATGGSGKGGGGGGGQASTAEDRINKLIETLTKEVVPKAIEFDSEAARKAAEQQWGPYYKQILADYLTEVKVGKAREKENLASYLKSVGVREKREKENLDETLKALGLKGKWTGEDLKTAIEDYGISEVRTKEDLGTALESYGIKAGRTKEDLASLTGLLGGRREEYMGEIARQSPLIEEAIGGRAADRGLYFSGEREEQQKLQKEKEARDIASYEKEYGYTIGQAQLGAERTQADITKQEEASRLAAERTQQNLARSQAATEQTAARTQDTLAKQRLLEQQQYGRSQEDLAVQQQQRELESRRYEEDVERQRKQRERELAQQREQAVLGGVETRREEEYLGY